MKVSKKIKRERSNESTPEKDLKKDKLQKKRKRSYSGIDLPDSEEIQDDFTQYKINPNIVEKLKLKQIENLFEVQKKYLIQFIKGKML